MSALTAIGLMSGTSFDGIDIALVETEGETIARLGPIGYRPYAEEERRLLQSALPVAAAVKNRADRTGALDDAERLVTGAHFQAVEAFLRANGIAREKVDIVGFHGQTVLHRPAAGLTVQIGDGAALASQLRIPVVYDFRAADMESGGEGAPLVPVYHRALARQLEEPHPIAVLNVGGVANVTYIDGDADPIAFDTGPGNAPIDEIVFARTGKRFDRDGILASQGTARWDIVESALSDPFFSRKPPKSLDRAQFARFPMDALTVEDAAATATAIVAGSIGRALAHLPRMPATWIVAGGGARNRSLMKLLRSNLLAPVLVAEAVSWSADALEAQAFAYLAVRSLKGLPFTFPTTTGVKTPMTGGVLVKP